MQWQCGQCVCHLSPDEVEVLSWRGGVDHMHVDSVSVTPVHLAVRQLQEAL